MRKISLALVLLYSISATTAQQPYPKTIQEQIAGVEHNLSGGLVIDGKPFTLADRMKHYNVPGLSVAIIDNYKIVWAKGYGYADKQENRMVTTSTLFEPGSISKSLNAVGVLLLAQDGKLDLYQDVNRYLSSWKFPYDTVSHGKKITAAQLLSHKAGLSVYGFPGYHRDSAMPNITDILDGKPPSNTPAVRSVSEPGTAFSYSGGGIMILQQMITDLAKQPYEDFMQRTVLGALGMNSSSFNQPPSAGMKKNLATGYKHDGTEVPGKYYVYPEKAAAGLWTNPTDLAKYMIEMQLAYNGRSAKVLKQEMVKLHVTPYGYGDAAMGTFIQDRNGERYFDHDASNEGFTGVFIGGLTNGKGAVIIVNSDNGYILFEMLNSIALVYHWPGWEKPEQITTVRIQDSILSKYVGEYITEGTLSAVRKENDGLYYWIDGVNSKMYFTSPIAFRNLEFPTAKAFTFDEAGEVNGYTRSRKDQFFSPGQRITSLDTMKPNPGQLGAFGRHLLERKEFDKAIRFLSKGVISDASDSSLQKDLAHCYLFAGDLEKAMDLYRRFSSSGGKDWKQTLTNDFDRFRKQGFDARLIDKAEGSIF